MSGESHVVSGRVLHGGEPLEGAYVRLIGPSGEYVSERRTGSDGAFKFHLSPAVWSLIAYAPGDLRTTREIEVKGDQQIDIELGGS